MNTYARNLARAEYVAEQTKALTESRLADESHVAEALSDAFGEDGGDNFAKALARFRAAFALAQTDCGMAEAGRVLFVEVDAVATSFIARDASTDAEHQAHLEIPDYDDADPEGLQVAA